MAYRVGNGRNGCRIISLRQVASLLLLRDIFTINALLYNLPDYWNG
ncbi:MAG TPA: hypothetical protein P5210_10690 [Draconibacterium sp.]|nr:hypothetical protein [Draconibacterium sp.]HRX12108.1 hypothetical protein [Draconibacterium sp.]